MFKACSQTAGLAFLALILTASSSTGAPSSPAPQPAAVVQTTPAAAPADTVAPARHTNSVVAEMRVALDREREQVAGLLVRLRQKPGHQEALDLQREIERVKLDTEAAILRIQAEAARKAGHMALAERLEVAAKGLLTPPAGTTLATRPTPRASSR